MHSKNILSENFFYDPEHRIISLLKYLKEDSARNDSNRNGMSGVNHTYIVPFTRQQIANMSGLRVETVIRTVKKMESDGKLQFRWSKNKTVIPKKTQKL